MEAKPPWVDLPPEITAAILHKLGAVEILLSAQYVCTTWRRVCQDPAMWRRVDIRYADDLLRLPHDFEAMCRHAVDLSRGQLIDLHIEYFGTNDLLLDISLRSRQLRRLQIVSSEDMRGEDLSEAFKSFPLLEELHLYYTLADVEAIESVGRACPLLKSFMLNERLYEHSCSTVCDSKALAVAQNMPNLLKLQIMGNSMTNEGVQAILDGCPNLESLDLRQCFNVRLDGDLEKLCSQRIIDLKLPLDPMDNLIYPEIYRYELSYGDADDYITGLSDVDVMSEYEYESDLEFSD